jgi:hypothetical protein
VGLKGWTGGDDQIGMTLSISKRVDGELRKAGKEMRLALSDSALSANSAVKRTNAFDPGSRRDAEARRG